uniref:Glucanase n=1 Tax=Penicillium granulatum TaxID=395885 RepID=T1WI91_9EURO|nr:cellobiohydrolase I [Penicillium granulatum]
MFAAALPSFLTLLAVASAPLIAEAHPDETWHLCTAGCASSQLHGSVVIDHNWKVHLAGHATNCYTGNMWDQPRRPDDLTCAQNCANYSLPRRCDVCAQLRSLRCLLNFVLWWSQKNIGSRLYLRHGELNTRTYALLLNQEFYFDVDVSNLPCGLIGALYFVSMDQDGGMASTPTNKAGAKYGTYCDLRTRRDLKFINGQANVGGWTPSAEDVNWEAGNTYSCCAEMDIWEANSISHQFQPHPCDLGGQTHCTGFHACTGGGTCDPDGCDFNPYRMGFHACTGTDRYGGTCDPDGCDFNPYRMGGRDFYGPRRMCFQHSPFTVVTQFRTNDGSTGTLSEIKRFYVQPGKVINQPQSTIQALLGNSITDSHPLIQKYRRRDTRQVHKHGGMAGMGAGLAYGMVLVMSLSMSLWDDHALAYMLWLDSTYPTDDHSTTPGALDSSCDISASSATPVEARGINAYVSYSNIKSGPLGSTFAPTDVDANQTTTTTKGTTTTENPTPTTTTSLCTCHTCGGIGYTGPTTCASPYTCQKLNPYYSQCL